MRMPGPGTGPSSGRSPAARCLPLALALVLAGSAAAWSQTLRNPRRIAAGPDGQLLVSDRHGGSVVAVDPITLKPMWSFALPQEGAPFGLATWDRRVYVGNTKTKNVEVYHLVGVGNRQDRRAARWPRNAPPVPRLPARNGPPGLRFLYNLGHVPPGDTGFLDSPTDIAVDPGAALVFVLDGAERKIEIFDQRGAFVAEFFPTDRDGILLSPVSLGIDEARRELLVGDYGDPSGSFRAREPARILIYSYGGALQFQIDGNGSTHASTQFARVQGLTASADGRIFAAEPLGSRVLVLDRASGALLAEIGSEGSAAGQLMLPLDVLLDRATGDLYVSNNRGARRVEAFRGAGR